MKNKYEIKGFSPFCVYKNGDRLTTNRFSTKAEAKEYIDKLKKIS